MPSVSRSLGSPPEVHARREVANLWLGVAFVGAEIRVRSGFVELWIQAGVVCPRRQVLPGEGQTDGPNAHAPRPLLRRVERVGQLAVLDEIRVFDESRFGAKQSRDGPCLLSQWCRCVLETSARLREVAAETLGQVEQLVTTAVIHQPGNAHVPEQRQLRCHRQHPFREGRTEVDAVRSEEHTSELQSQSKLVCRLLLEKK